MATMAEIYIIDINENITNAMWNRILQIISKCKREQIEKYRFETDAKRSAYGEILIRYLICKRTNIMNEDIEFSTNKYGKPYFNNQNEMFFNISHSGRYVVCGWSEHEIGIDVEKKNTAHIEIAKKYFAEDEYKTIISKGEQEQSHLFYEYWTLKESYIKYKGLGLRIPLKQCEFVFDGMKYVLMSEDSKKLNFFHYDIDTEHKMALCTEDINVSSLSFMTIHEILHFFDHNKITMNC